MFLLNSGRETTFQHPRIHDSVGNIRLPKARNLFRSLPVLVVFRPPVWHFFYVCISAWGTPSDTGYRFYVDIIWFPISINLIENLRYRGSGILCVHSGVITDTWQNMFAVNIIVGKPRPTPNIGISVGVLLRPDTGQNNKACFFFRARHRRVPPF